MEPTESTFGITPATMARMLAIGEDGERADADAVSMTMLQRHLALVLDNRPSPPGSTADLIGGQGPQFAAVAGRTLGTLLEEGDAPLEPLEGAKAYAKRVSESHRQDPMRTVAAVLYYAAVGRALVDHDTKITRHDFDRLARSYRELQTMGWIGDRLADLFRQAGELCTSRAGAS